MDRAFPKNGLVATEKLYEQYISLLSILGKGSLLLKKDVKSPYSVPESCENTNKMVSELIAAMKSTLKDVKMSYEFCQKEFEQNKDRMPNLNNLETPVKMEIDTSPEYIQLHQELQKKNTDLKIVIDEMQKISADINQLAPL